MIDLKKHEFWFVTGSQELYGGDVLKKVDEHSKAMVKALDAVLPCTLVWKPVATGSDAIRGLVRQAGADPKCAGIVTWMHTFSPSKM
ncbi:MAG: L-arabinose isomerase, partial [Treponema sp.]|nr:L-arabinose isomerase [Treponema sp.]